MSRTVIALMLVLSENMRQNKDEPLAHFESKIYLQDVCHLKQAARFFTRNIIFVCILL